MLQRISHKVKVVMVAAAIAGVSAGAAMAVSAAIPDENGVITGCYRGNGSLSVIDTATEQCAGNETTLSWNQTGPQGEPGTPATGGGSQTAHAAFNADGTLDTDYSVGIEDAKIVDITYTVPDPYRPEGFREETSSIACFKVGFQPKSASQSSIPEHPSNGGGVSPISPVVVRGYNQDNDAWMDTDCGADYNALTFRSPKNEAGEVLNQTYTFFK